MPRPPSDPYAPPAAEDLPSAGLDVEESFEATKTTTIVRVAAGLLAGIGVLLEMSALQLLLNFRIIGLAQIVTYAMIATGGGVFFLAAKLARQRVWAALLGRGLASALALATVLWLVLLFGSGVFSLYALLLPPLCVAAAITSHKAIGQCRRATAARERLRGEGVVADF